jgi:hypothetical protein
MFCAYSKEPFFLFGGMEIIITSDFGITKEENKCISHSKGEIPREDNASKLLFDRVVPVTK